MAYLMCARSEDGRLWWLAARRSSGGTVNDLPMFVTHSDPAAPPDSALDDCTEEDLARYGDHDSYLADAQGMRLLERRPSPARIGPRRRSLL